MSDTSLSRRGFLAGAAVAAAGVAGLGLASNTAHAAVDAADVTWDGEYDVVVLGMGFAGSVAAITAADEGVSVLLCDKAPEGSQGGNSRVCGQYIQATDDADIMYDYLSALVGDFPNWDPDVLRAHVDGTRQQFDWLVNTMGADPNILLQDEPWDTAYSKAYYTEAFDGRGGYVQNWAEFPEYEGAEHCLSFLVSGDGFDSAFYQLCQENIEKRDIECWFSSPGQHLITDENGDVVGVQIDQDGETKNIKANGGVVLACGGFEYSPEMLADFMMQKDGCGYGSIYNTGDGVRMGEEVGAVLWHMGNGAAFLWGYRPEGSQSCLWAPISTSRGIFIGPNGSRFVNEQAESRHGRIPIAGEFFIRQTPHPSYNMMDSALAAEYKLHSSFSAGNVDEIESGIVLSGDTLAELAEKMGVDAENLEATVERFNQDYEAGRDADYGRPYDTIVGPISTPPYYALKMTASLLNTQGGPRRNQYAQVVDVNLDPINGLFSAGELGALWPDNYNGGGNVGECCTFGRLAGGNAAKRAKGEF